jgi:hypothetical protein
MDGSYTRSNHFCCLLQGREILHWDKRYKYNGYTRTAFCLNAETEE